MHLGEKEYFETPWKGTLWVWVLKLEKTYVGKGIWRVPGSKQFSVL